MTDTKRNFLYNFNRTLRSLCADNASIESVFENIDNGTLKLIPNELINSEFIGRVDKLIFIIKKIVSEPFKVVSGAQMVVPASEAKSVDHESIKLTLADASLWNLENGQMVPTRAYTVVNEDVFINYENAFICQLIKLLIIRLKMIKLDIIRASGVNQESFENNSTDSEYAEVFATVSSQINKLNRLSKQKIFIDNSKRAIDLSNVFYTDTLKHDKRYNFCYMFFMNDLKAKQSEMAVTKDFRVLYHNFVLVQIIYKLHRLGYVAEENSYHIAISGKMIVDAVSFKGNGETISITRTANGINVSKGDNLIHVEFSKSVINGEHAILADFSKKSEKLAKLYDKYFVSYFASSDYAEEGIIPLGYKNPQEAISKLIKAI